MFSLGASSMASHPMKPDTVQSVVWTPTVPAVQVMGMQPPIASVKPPEQQLIVPQKHISVLETGGCDKHSVVNNLTNVTVENKEEISHQLWKINAQLLTLSSSLENEMDPSSKLSLANRIAEKQEQALKTSMSLLELEIDHLE
jgi:hypothetical protein